MSGQNDIYVQGLFTRKNKRSTYTANGKAS